MFSKTIEFEDFNGNQKTQEFFFHMSKAELMEMAAEGNELMDRLQRIIDTKDIKGILVEVRAIVASACGVRSEDGSRFLKTPEAKSVLLDSPAYDELLLHLCGDANAMTDFVDKLLPAKLREQMLSRLQSNDGEAAVVKLPEDNRPDWLKEGRTPTHAELIKASPEELQMAFRTSGK